MDTYSILRHFADSWMLLFMFLFFSCVILRVLIRKASHYKDPAEMIFRHEDRPAGSDKTLGTEARR